MRNINKSFGGLLAINDLSFKVEENTIVGLIGPNGAGKTTVFNIICGFYQPDKGDIFFNGQESTAKRPDEIARRGIARTFQTTRLFPDRTVWENVIHGRHVCNRSGIFLELAGSRNVQKEEHENGEKVLEILNFLNLLPFRNHLGKNIPLGFQRRLAIAIALATEPKLLLLDEPAAGMNPQETLEIMDFVSHLRKQGLGILLIEHDMKVVMGICQLVIVLNYGMKIAEVIEAYLGKGAYA
jgi:branched-chain amino acid transport system ATP-binding protein